MRVFVTGGGGFTGERVVRRLCAENHAVTCLVRASTHTEVLQELGVEIAVGDLGDPSGWSSFAAGHDVIIHVASMGFGHAPAMMEGARKAGVPRVVCTSTTALFTNLNARSIAVRTAAETTVMQSGLDWTIMRPTMIYGSHKDRNMCRLIRLVDRWPVIPMLGSGRSLQQPIHVDDVARFLVAAAVEPVASRTALNVSGADPLDFRTVIRTIASLLGRRRRLLPLPASPIVGALQLAQWTRIPLPLKAEQVQRLNEDKAFDHDEAVTLLGVQPRNFRDGIAPEIEEMQSLGLISARRSRGHS
jgi:nucleoside-diphosphate-sugar epimerase